MDRKLDYGHGGGKAESFLRDGHGTVHHFRVHPGHLLFVGCVPTLFQLRLLCAPRRGTASVSGQHSARRLWAQMEDLGEIARRRLGFRCSMSPNEAAGLGGAEMSRARQDG